MKNIFFKIKALFSRKAPPTNNTQLIVFGVFNLLLGFAQALYIYLRFDYINDVVPIFYTRDWGLLQLGEKPYLFLIPLTSLLLTCVTLFILYKLRDYFFMYLKEIIVIFVSITNLVLTASLIRIIMLASVPFPPLIDPIYLSLFWPFWGAFLLAYVISPKIIQKFQENGILTNPTIHSHPAMILKSPSARGGGFIFTIVLIICGLIFIESTGLIISIYVAAFLLALLGIFDDYQNAKPKTRLRFLENPVLRLCALALIVLVPISAGIRVNFIGNPLNGIVDLTSVSAMLFGYEVFWLAVLVTLFWFVWVMNTLSWSNGVDGQYAGIVGIACIMIALLAFRFSEMQPIHLQMAQLAIIASGAAFGLVKYTWYPSKVLWGFGAMSAGLIIATTSIVIGSKIAVAIIIILVPFLDALVTISRRLLQGKNPLRGDSGHLHHLLLEQGWGVRRIAIFYWVTAVVFGLIGVVSADRDVFLLSLVLGGLVGVFIVGLNFSQRLRQKLRLPRSE